MAEVGRDGFERGIVGLLGFAVAVGCLMAIGSIYEANRQPTPTISESPADQLPPTPITTPSGSAAPSPTR